ncbi:hypothetical protein A3L11_00085 [Thermococcus siculi]|uniref:D-glucuronyl C5-epimerase C-terminal domain-containing protein n=2 Tax=Thermococcus siculi TaxID=72803 RepID=A0A2Z2MU72_9EURY|nr:hypothetical protein A3L11_00085 [Thermococcus siculi]
MVVISGCLGNHWSDTTSPSPGKTNGTWESTGIFPPLPSTTPSHDIPNTSDHAFLASLYPPLRGELENNSIISKFYPDAAYTVHVFAGIARKRPLTPSELRILKITLQANNCYFSRNLPPSNSYYVVSFSEERPVESIPYVECPNFTSRLPFVYYKGRGFQYYPVTASNWAYHYLKTGEVKEAEALLGEMLPLMETANTSEGKAGVFRVYFSPPEGSPVPWTSSFSQGMLAGLYAWLYNEMGNKTYINASRLLFNSFYIPLEDGGFVENTGYGVWFLEYPYRPDFLVLNGHIITMKGLWYYYRFTGDERALELFNEGVESVRKALPDCDTGNWSLYSVNGPEAREDYHRLHIKLLLWLYARTGDETFLQYAEKWNGYLEKKGLEKEDINALLQQVRNTP